MGTGYGHGLVCAALAGVTVSLAITGPQETFGAGIDRLQNVENLTGSSFNDTLTGDADANTIAGGAGNDVLMGGVGNDKFVFDAAPNAATNVDQITDFNVVADTIVLANAVFTAITGTGTLTAAQFAANATGTAQDADDHVVYDTGTGKLFYDSNGNAAGGATQFAQLNPWTCAHQHRLPHHLNWRYTALGRYNYWERAARESRRHDLSAVGRRRAGEQAGLRRLGCWSGGDARLGRSDEGQADRV